MLLWKRVGWWRENPFFMGWAGSIQSRGFAPEENLRAARQRSGYFYFWNT
jgi:hypothetical protein